MPTDPRFKRLSDHFVLSDFLGCHSVYSKGYANPFEDDEESEFKLENATALCVEALEPIMEKFGPLSVGYGYISPDLSRRIVKYQDPEKPSHHRWDLGAACDVCVHRYVSGEFKTIDDLYLNKTAIGSPISLGFGIDYLDVPYSRLITYSESPYVCIAVAAREIVSDRPRKAFYENRFHGTPKVKPDYRQYSTAVARNRAFNDLQHNGLPHDWMGAGYPTYHNGGFRQFHHTRVSRYTMVSDWLFDLKSISHGEKNVPSLNLDSVQDAFAAAGIVYDFLIDSWGIKRASIVQGYVSHKSKFTTMQGDWRNKTIYFKLNAPPRCRKLTLPPGAMMLLNSAGLYSLTVEVDTVLESEEWT